jgi:microsomal epoxide hydrolase
MSPHHRCATEAKLNSLPQFTAVIQGFTLHFIGIFSPDPAAIPLVLFHGWPGSFYEYYPVVHELQKSTSQSFHIIVPSLPGYTFSSPPPLDRDFSVIEVTEIMNELIVGLGLKNYIAVGGDIGAAIASEISKFPECKGIHSNYPPPHTYSIHADPHPTVNFNMTTPRQGPQPTDISTLPPHELAGLDRGKIWMETGFGYSLEHGTRPSTISHVLSSSPLALLAWVGEKFLDWTDEDPSVDFVLEMATLWWLTETFPTSIYPYREVVPPHALPTPGDAGKVLMRYS